MARLVLFFLAPLSLLACTSAAPVLDPASPSTLPPKGEQPTPVDDVPEDDFSGDGEEAAGDQVAADRTAAGTDLVDEKELHDRVQEALEKAPGLDESTIRIVVRGADVHLSGTVRSDAEKQSAHATAAAVRGVGQVFIEELRVAG